MNKDEIRTRILSENTAQGVLNHLRTLESNRKYMQRRWIWELLQNARDTSTNEDTRLVADVNVRRNELLFQHNGHGFTEDEVCHLIYHGSTKVEDEETIGEYGSGFLTTHLISPEIDVAGQLVDGRSFQFLLRREVSSASDLSSAMDKAWDEFYASLAPPKPIPGGSITQFRYPLHEGAMKAVDDGLDMLVACASLVVVFNPQFRRINVSLSGEKSSFEVIERLPSQQQGLQTITVEAVRGGTRTRESYLVIEGELACVAVPLAVVDNRVVCLPLRDVPKLFLGFPLIGTENFSFPGAINSFHFTPTPERDGVYLAQASDEGNRINQEIIEEASRLQVELVRFAARSGYASVHTLTDLPELAVRSWLDEDWLRGQLDTFIHELRRTPAVVGVTGATAPESAILPLARTEQGTKALWHLLNDVIGFRTKLPKGSEVTGWYRSISSWAAVRKREASSFREGFDVGRLAKHLEQQTKVTDGTRGSLDALRQLLAKDVRPIDWLNRLYQFFSDDSRDALLRETRLIVSETGHLDKLSNLYRDKGVDESLKDIADDLLGLRIREYLRDPRLSTLSDEVGKGDRTNDSILSQIVRSLNERCAEDDLAYDVTQASANTLAWIVREREWKYLEGFPVLSRHSNDDNRQVLRMDQLSNDDPDVPLAPVGVWSEGLQEYADVFPWSYIVADTYYDAMPDPEGWRILSERGYIRKGVLFRAETCLNRFLPDEPLTEEEDHRTIDDVTVSELVFLTKDRVGIMERVRSSESRARLFWRFLTEWLVNEDENGLAMKRAHCTCSSDHRYYGSGWLAPLRDRKWVPQGNGVRDRVTARSLARLLRGHWSLPTDPAKSPSLFRFLDAMRVTRLGLVREFLVDGDESRLQLDDTMANFLASNEGDLRSVSEFVKDLKSDEGLVDHLAERRARRRIVLENQRLGESVENLVKQALEGVGFSVRRTGIGSDVVMKYDLIVDDEEVGIELSDGNEVWLVEVKATRGKSVRMTARQAETCIERGSQFLLCVVPVDPNGNHWDEAETRGKMRFVQNIGPRVEPLYDELDALKELRDVARAVGDGNIRLEVEAGTARIRIGESVWQYGIGLEGLAAQLLRQTNDS